MKKVGVIVEHEGVVYNRIEDGECYTWHQMMPTGTGILGIIIPNMEELELIYQEMEAEE